MRLFIAIPVPENLHTYCKQMQSQFEELKKTNDFHLTLQFLGNGIETADEIIKALSQIEFKAFEIEMGDIVPFGPRNKPRGIWIECKKNEILKALAEEVQSRMTNLGYDSDKPFRAHVTLGRYRNTPRVIPEKVKGTSHRFLVEHFELMQSHLNEGGPRHKILKEIFAK